MLQEALVGERRIRAEFGDEIGYIYLYKYIDFINICVLLLFVCGCGRGILVDLGLGSS